MIVRSGFRRLYGEQQLINAGKAKVVKAAAKPSRGGKSVGGKSSGKRGRPA